jgi:glycerol-3-phosphate responsive antiterminator
MSTGRPMPSTLVRVGGRDRWPAALPSGAGVMVAGLDLEHLIQSVAGVELPVIVDLDQVDGLAPDERAVAFLVRRLEVSAIVTRHASAAAAAVDLGTAAFLRVHALDSTGLERSLAAHPRTAGLGTAIAPGLVLPYLTPDQLAALPRPLLAYGLLRTAGEVDACRRVGARCVLETLRLLTELPIPS